MRAAIYLRVSTDHDEQKLSPEHQLAACRQYIEEIGLETDDALVYNDAGLSGTEMEKRIEVKRLVADARNGKFASVVFTAISRFARDLSDALNLKKRLETLYGIRIISVEEGYDSAIEGRNSEMVFTVHAMVAAHKSQEMSKSIRRGLRQSAASGRHIGNVSPYGYSKTPNKKLVPDPKTAPIVREIFNLYLMGMGSKSIAEELNRRGISSAKAKKWQASTINSILHNPVYRGDLVANKWRTDTDIELSRRFDAKIKRQMRRQADDWVIVQGNHEAIINEATYQAVQQMLAVKAANRGVRRNTNVLSGLLRCAECGGAAIVRSGKKDKNGRAYKYVECAALNRIGKDACKNHASINYYDVLDAVLNPLKQYSASAEMMDQLVDMILQSVEGRHIGEQIAGLHRQLEHNEKRQKESLRSYTEGVFSLEMVKEHQMELQIEAKRIQDEIARLETQLAGQGDLASQRKEFEEMLNVFRHIDQYDTVTVRSVIAAVVDLIEVTADRRLKILWKWDSEQFSRLSASLM